MISHNIFYTSITRSKKKLKIYWSPETEKRVLENMKEQFNDKDYRLFREKFKSELNLQFIFKKIRNIARTIEIDI